MRVSIKLQFHAENGCLRNSCLTKSIQQFSTNCVNSTYILRTCITSFTWTFTCTFSTTYPTSVIWVPWDWYEKKSVTVTTIGCKYHEAKRQQGLFKPQRKDNPINRISKYNMLRRWILQTIFNNSTNWQNNEGENDKLLFGNNTVDAKSKPQVDS